MSHSGIQNNRPIVLGEDQYHELWMGEVQPYMSEEFILNAFYSMGENPLSVRLMRNRSTDELSGYCFVHFETEADAIKAMHNLNGKHIPNSKPFQLAKFRLATITKDAGNSKVDSLWVYHLPPGITEYQLYQFFASRYESIASVKVIKTAGFKKSCVAYGFIQFANEEERLHCRVHVNGFKEFPGTKQLVVLCKVPPIYKRMYSTLPTGGYSPSYDYSIKQVKATNYWHSYTVWQTPNQELGPNSLLKRIQVPKETTQSQSDIIDHSTHNDVDAWNRDLIERDFNMWDALESSKWMPLTIV